MTQRWAGDEDCRACVESLQEMLPPPLAPLAELAYNYWWSWAPGGHELWRSFDPHRWEISGGNPVRLLDEARAETLRRAAADEVLLTRMDSLHRAFVAMRDRAPSSPVPLDRPVGFFCMEYGIHRTLPIFAGGLGALAGDLLKEASDRALPLLGVGLFYHQGYLRQRLDTSGWQHEYWSYANPERLPLALVSGADGHPLTVTVQIRNRDVVAQVWRANVGRVPLYLLDTQRPENHPLDRWITARLYVSDPTFRLAQYALLGMGGMRTLAAMGIDPSVIHMNEGHAVLAALEASRAGGIEETRERGVFTTHTPVAAGNESYDSGHVRDVVGEISDEVIDLGRSGPGEPFGLTQFGLRMSAVRNGVSRLHGRVARDMWRHLYDGASPDDVPIGHVTNGVHLPTWMAPPMRDLLDRYLGNGWSERAHAPETWAGVDDIPDADLWDVRNRLRASLVVQAHARATVDRLARGEPIDYVEAAAHAFDPDRLTLGFARRATGYKRLYLLGSDPERALRLLSDPQPVQVLLAGKSHPADEEAKRIVQDLFRLKSAPGVGDHVAYLEDYNLDVASWLVAGCDVWVNLPRPPLEASGTSGMKAAMNGVLNLSVVDGWWAEGYDGTNGWAIVSSGDGGPEAQDARDAQALYDILENEVLPLFSDRDESGVPRGWVAMIKASLRTIGPRFSATRMLNDYVARAYGPIVTGS